MCNKMSNELWLYVLYSCYLVQAYGFNMAVKVTYYLEMNN